MCSLNYHMSYFHSLLTRKQSLLHKPLHQGLLQVSHITPALSPSSDPNSAWLNVFPLPQIQYQFRIFCVCDRSAHRHYVTFTASILPTGSSWASATGGCTAHLPCRYLREDRQQTWEDLLLAVSDVEVSTHTGKLFTLVSWTQVYATTTCSRAEGRLRESLKLLNT